jgi:hypothetical protein
MSAKLGELISGVKRAIVDAHRSVGAQHLEELAQFFDYHGQQSPPPDFPKGEWKPRVVRVKVPGEGRPDHHVDVPLITLLPLRSFVIERAEILTHINLGLSTQEPETAVAGDGTQAAERTDWDNDGMPEVTVQMTPSEGQAAEIKIVVHGIDVPPGLQRLSAAYEKLLNAQLPT